MKETKLEQIRDYLIRHKRFVTTNKNDLLDERNALKYWEGYEDALAAFEDKVESLLRISE